MSVTLVRRLILGEGILALIASLSLSALLYLGVLFSLCRADGDVKKKKAPAGALDRGAPFGYNRCIYGRPWGGEGE